MVFTKKILSLALITSIPFFLNACISPQEEAMANQVITALPSEVEGCTFLGNVDADARFMIGQARFDLKLQAARLGATHLVETFAYARQMSNLTCEIGVALSGRAYKCPIGKGPIVENPKAQATLPYDLPNPQVNLPDRFSLIYGPSLGSKLNP